MLRISRTCAVIFLLMGISLGGCNNISAVTPVREETQSLAIATATPIPLANMEWFGMQISSDLWQVEEIQDALYQHGSLTHRSLTGCRAWILSEDPAYISGYDPNYNNSTLEQFKTNEIRMDLRRMKDQEGNLRDIYFEVFDTTGQTGFDEYRLAFFLVETGEDPLQCLEALHTVLLTLKPELFPDLGTGQG